MADDFGAGFQLTLITADVELAKVADIAGVQRIGVDLEFRDKADRQRGAENRISGHSLEDLRAVGCAGLSAQLFVRVNALHSESAAEIDGAVRIGANIIMLPYFQSADEVRRFVDMVGGRARVAILVETAPALVRIRSILDVPGIDEVSLGFNDLRHDLRAANHFEVMASPLVDVVAAETIARGLPLSMGGIARGDDTSLPMPPDLVYAQYPRLHARGAWLARSFLRVDFDARTFEQDVQALRARLNYWGAASTETLEAARRELALRASLLAHG
jgi:hypothetical protein